MHIKTDCALLMDLCRHLSFCPGREPLSPSSVQCSKNLLAPGSQQAPGPRPCLVLSGAVSAHLWQSACPLGSGEQRSLRGWAPEECWPPAVKETPPLGRTLCSAEGQGDNSPSHDPNTGKARRPVLGLEGTSLRLLEAILPPLPHLVLRGYF